MKDFFNRTIALGFGIAAESKEQIEKVVDELVKKGEVTRQESSEMIDELVKKGEETRQKFETVVQERVQAVVGERNWVPRSEYDALVQRVEKLEQQMNNHS
ncbi:phasin family protein [Paenibacillus selenitireducens]|nr:hypothetical protein [Paenibacillus selenitireducens]